MPWEQLNLKETGSSEDDYGKKIDRCFADSLVKGSGLVLGAGFSILFLKRRSWPLIFGSGVGIGIACRNCERELRGGFYQIESLAGDTIKLPCNVSTYKDDHPVLILWYRDNEETPIYSVDIRVGSSNTAKHWYKKSVFGNRARFICDNGPGELLIRNALDDDTGVYRCRVDFVKAQTRNIKINLTIISSPERICIKDEMDNEKSAVIGPYNEHDFVVLKCEVYGGNPSPKITWYHENKLITSQTKLLRNDVIVNSEIHFGPLKRAYLNTKLICKANNHPLVLAMESIVQIDMNFAPIYIRLLGAKKALSAGRRYDILCQSAGSRPPAILTWWYDGLRLQKAIETVSSDGNETTSTLSISLNKTHSGKYLSCRAYNYAVSKEPLEDGTRLDIQYAPEPIVRLGATLDPNSIREGMDVYFDCSVLSYPTANKIEWQRNGRTLNHNVSLGIIISNVSLVLQSVTREMAGEYACVAYNTEGKGSSPLFSLNVIYTPKCVYNQPRIYGVAKHENVEVKCTVDANPPVVDFFWTFNNSAETIAVASNHVKQSGTSSIVAFTPINELDYGSLLCVASNRVGRQDTPCVFHIISAGKPDVVSNCSFTDLSTSSLTVLCGNGFDGGLPQSFYLEIKDIKQDELIVNITSNIPKFVVKTLTPGAFYLISIYAFNSKGRSEPTNLNIAMLKMSKGLLISETDANSQSMFLLSSAMSLTIGLIFSAIMVGITIAWASLMSWKALDGDCGKIYKKREECVKKSSPVSSTLSFDGIEIYEADLDEKSPDIIPENNDSELQIGNEIELGTTLSFYSLSERKNWPIVRQ